MGPMVRRVEQQATRMHKMMGRLDVDALALAAHTGGNIPECRRDGNSVQINGATSEWWSTSSRNGGRVQPGISNYAHRE
jgi:hypothetical protein